MYINDTDTDLIQTMITPMILLTYTQIGNHHCSKDSTMQDYCDSPGFKEHPLYKEEPNALQIQLYYDDVEVVNPLGRNTKVHKLGT